MVAVCQTTRWVQSWRKWSEDLQMNIKGKKLRNVCILTHKCSISTKAQETAYKLLTHWYTTPEKLHRWQPQTPDTCWWCQCETGTLIHIWWHCPLLATFWNKVREIITFITETKLTLNAAFCLLHVTDFTLKKYKHSLSKHLLNAANP